jgi:uncharacterized Zn-binding protein involved in type VI secretion
LQQGIWIGDAIALPAPVPTNMIYYTVQQMPGALAGQQIVRGSVTVVVLGILAAFLGGSKATG